MQYNINCVNLKKVFISKMNSILINLYYDRISKFNFIYKYAKIEFIGGYAKKMWFMK